MTHNLVVEITRSHSNEFQMKLFPLCAVSSVVKKPIVIKSEL